LFDNGGRRLRTGKLSRRSGFFPFSYQSVSYLKARRDRRHWQSKYERLAREIDTEPERVRRSYDVVADRLEIVGLVHLCPKSN
jgi:hypothetical protein